MSPTDRLPFLDGSDPETWKALNDLALEVAVAAESAGLERETRQVMEAGATVQRLAQLPAWRDSALFGQVECAAVTMNARNRISILSEHPVKLRTQPAPSRTT
ncbi:hypothetical protein [Janibacter sp. GS2]|uniref:hypothetical protein n=1 Tax=Janibacter sp. GS2 TaxID=3442646 RepID=UPI003EB9221F